MAGPEEVSMVQDTDRSDRTADLWRAAEKAMATYRLYAEELAAGAACRTWGQPATSPAPLRVPKA
jgi:hypothetical protein